MGALPFPIRLTIHPAILVLACLVALWLLTRRQPEAWVMPDREATMREALRIATENGWTAERQGWLVSLTDGSGNWHLSTPEDIVDWHGLAPMIDEALRAGLAAVRDDEPALFV